MSDENLGDVLDESYLAHKRGVAIKVLGERTHLTMERITKLLEHPTHGEIIKTITLQDLLDVKLGDTEEAEDDSGSDEEVAAAPAPRKKAGKKAAKKKAKKATKKKTKKAAKKATKKKAPKKAAKKKTTKKKTKAKSADGKKADFGSKKPRLNYEVGCKEVLSALRAIKEPASNGQLVATTGYPAVQVRAFLKKLEADKKVKRHGTGKATKYSPK